MLQFAVKMHKYFLFLYKFFWLRIVAPFFHVPDAIRFKEPRQFFLNVLVCFFFVLAALLPAGIAQAASESTVDESISTGTVIHNGSSPTTVFTTESIGYAFYIDSNGTVAYKKTTNGGASWGTSVTVHNVTTSVRVAVWFDQWTPGDTTGTIIHIVVTDTTNDEIYYGTLDTATDTLVTPVVITTSGATITSALNNLTITK